MNEYTPQSLYYRILGPENPTPNHYPVVLVHGLMGFAANWGKIWPDLQKTRAVLVLDQRGHGKSDKPNTGYAPEDYAKDLAALLAKLGWEKCHIVGHSMGGRVALYFAKYFPQYTFSLTMEDSGAAPNPHRVDWIKNLLGSVPTPFSDRNEAKRFFTEKFRDDPLTGSFLHANLETKNDGKMDWKFHAPGMIETVERGRATDAMAEFKSLSIPILVVRGSKSREFPQSEAEEMAKSNPHSKLVVIEGAGHYVHAEKPKEFTEALSAFLQKIENN